MGVTNKDQCREAFEHDQRVAATRALDDALQRKGVYLTWPTVTGLVDIVWAARSAPAAPVELPEPIGVVRVFEPHEGVGKICSEASTDITRLPIGRSLLYTEQQVRELLSQVGTVVAETPESPPKSAETRMDASSDRGGEVLPAGWVAVPVEPTEEMHVAACRVLQRANGLDGTPKRMLDAMLAAAPKLREKRQPLSDEQIKGVLEIVKTVIACVNEAHHAKSEGWRDGCFASADSAYSRIEPYLREIGIEEQS